MFVIDLKPSNFSEIAAGVETQAEQLLLDAAQNLATQTYGHIVEEVNDKLHSTREKYLQHLHLKPEGNSAWVVSLDPEANFIEEGMSRHEMVMQILQGGKSPLYAKDGSMYKVIPFKFNKAPNVVPPAIRDFQNVLKREFKKAGIPYGKIEQDAAGNPIVGKLHKLDIMDKPIKTMNGVGQGMGPIGQVRQGLGGTPILQAINVFQRQVTGKNGAMQYVKDVMTFRVVSSKHVGSGRWVHPGIKPHKFMDEAYKWAKSEWETSIRPAIEQQIVQLRNERRNND